jgi:hypothetical protein
MPRRLTPEQEALRRAAVEAHRKKVEFRLGLADRIRAEYERQSLKVELEESLAANKAIAAGVSKTRVRTDCGYGVWQTFENMLALTKDKFENPDAPRRPWEIVWDGERPKEVIVWEYQDVHTKEMVAGKVVMPTKWSDTYKTWGVSPASADEISYGFALRLATEIEAAIAAENPAPPEDEKPKTDAYNQPTLDDDYFTPKWTLGQAEEDEDDV